MRTLLVLALLALALTLGVLAAVEGVHDGRTLLAVIALAAAAIINFGGKR